jgi:NADH-quinone oxidoreductase subunit L
VSAAELAWLVPALPLAGAVVNLFWGRRLRTGAGVLASSLLAGSFAISVALLVDLLDRPAGERVVLTHLFDWISVGGFTANADLRIDPLSVTMILVVTGVGALIHVYAIGYMAGDPRFGRFFSYMNLFAFFMLLLVLAENYLLLYVGWEGVGLCSYLLIGFWHERDRAASAAKKAFVTTRIGDTAMLVGLALIVVHLGTLDMTAVLGDPGARLSEGAATAIALLLFAGAVGKSAQVPLHVWLPDAMEGPTPVSALIHAATMVTAGVYLVVRSHAIFELSEVALPVVLLVGLVTAVYAGTAALAQDDIKRVLAYSTVSQLGYMFLAAGMRAYALAMFMLVAHAFYKALMFLSAGAVIHGLHDEQNMRRMGGLRRAMPATFALFSLGALSLSGVPFLAGSYAKDHILSFASASGRPIAYALGTAGAFLSAFYIARLIFLTFLGDRRSDRPAHEAPPVMTIPLVPLAAGAVAGGWLGLSVEGGRLGGFLEPVVGAAHEGSAGPPEVTLVAISTVVALAGIAAAYVLYGSGRVDWAALRARLAPLHAFLQRGWRIDDAYAVVVQTPGKAAAAFAAYVVDARVIDGAVNGVGSLVRGLAAAGRRVQTGFVRNYALGLLAGAVGLLVYVGFRL